MRLFWKIFLLLMVALLLTAIASIWIGQAWMQAGEQSEQQLERLRNIGANAVSIYESGGLPAYRRWQRHTLHNNRVHGALLTPDGQPVLARPLPPELERLAQQFLHRNHDLSVVRPPLLAVASRIAGDSGHYIWLAGIRMTPAQMQQQGQTMMLLRLGLMLLALALISWVISRMVTRPIRLLEETSEQLGHGDLGARTPATLSARRDEIGELACSVDTMAAQIESLLNSHQQILRDISHELRSPLARLQVALELARNEAGERAVDELDRIETEASRLNELIGAVLTLARFDESGLVLEQSTLRLDQILQELAADSRFEAERADKQIDYRQPDACKIRGDRLWITRALDNVIRNAIRHTPEQSSVEIELNCEDGEAVIRVRDHGSGVATSQLPHLFEPFFRASEAREHFPDGGYGLGLSIAQRAIALHGGDISAANHPDGGLVVTITLPCVEDASQSTGSPACL